MPSRQPRWPSIGLDSFSMAARWATWSTETPAALATSSISAAGVGQELVQRRIEQADRHRQALHDAEQLDEIVALHRQDLGERRAAALDGLGHDHLAHGDDALAVEEHMLGAAEPDALGAEAARRAGIERASRHWCAPSCARNSSAQPISSAKSPESSGWMVGTSPSITSPVAPSMVMRSPSLHHDVAHRHDAAAARRCADRRRRRRKAGPCRARPPRRGWSCRRASSGCRRRHACRGCPRGWSRCGPGSPSRPWRRGPRPRRR